MKLIFIPKKDSHPDTIGADIALSVTLRSLAGGSYLDIVDLHGIRESTFYDIISKTLRVLEFVLQYEKVPENSWKGLLMALVLSLVSISRDAREREMG